MNNNQSKSNQPSTNMTNSNITEEQISDVYAAGTSDGILQSKNKKTRVEQKGYEIKPQN